MIYVFLANGFEEVEAFTPIDYLRRCEELKVLTVGVTGKMVTGSHQITTISDVTLLDVVFDEIEMIVLPGGMPGTINLEKSAELCRIINFCIEQSIPIGAICAAPSILGHMGLLKGRNATCAEGFEDELYGANILHDAVVKDGNIITARGAGVSNQFAFALVEVLTSTKRVNKLIDSVRWVR